MAKFLRALPAAAVALCAFASVSQARSLVDELEDLLSIHAQIQAGKELVTASEHGVDKAFSGFLPRVTFIGDVGRENTEFPGDQRRAKGEDEFTGTRRKATVTVTQNVFNGFRDQALHKGAQYQKDAAENDLESTRQKVLLEGATAYYEVLKSRRLVELAKRNIDTIQTQMRLEDERVQRGSGIAVDVLFAKSRLQVAKERMAGFEGELENSNSRFTQVFYRPPAVERIQDAPKLDPLIPGDLRQATEIALKDHPEVRASVLKGDVADERREAAKGPLFPRFDIVGRLNYENDVDGVDGRRNDRSIVLQATYDLFRGFGDQADAAQAASEASAVRINHQFVMRKVLEQSEIAYQQLQTIRQRRQLLENAVNIASEVFEARRRLRDSGKETALNVLDAENEVYLAQINLARAQYDERIAEFRLLQALGRLDIESLRQVASR